MKTAVGRVAPRHRAPKQCLAHGSGCRGTQLVQLAMLCWLPVWAAAAHRVLGVSSSSRVVP